ncbi:MAG: hypothetical protein ABSC35_01365 [Candidatus Dormibacteria bacterium]
MTRGSFAPPDSRRARSLLCVSALVLPAAGLAACSSSGGPAPTVSARVTGSPSSVAKACTPTWSTDAIPLPPGSQSGGESGAADLLVANFFTIQSLSAVSTSDIWAAGQSVVGATQTGQALVEHWNGAAWSIVPVQHAGDSDMDWDRSEDLTSVDAISSNDAWAVGFYPANRPAGDVPSTVNVLTLVEHWNGTAWSIVPAPDATKSDNLNSVSGDSSNDVWAVGGATYGLAYGAGSGAGTMSYDAPLVEHWNGSTWTIVPAPTIGLDPHNPAALAKVAAGLASGADENPASADFTSVHAISPDDVWAVGIRSFTNPDQETYTGDQTFTEHWDGTKWSVVAAPDVTVPETSSSAEDDLQAVTGSDGDVWAVGRAQPIGTLVLHWNGTAWSILPSPQTGENGVLETVADLAPNNVWAAGDEIDHWNGQTWSQIPTINGSAIQTITAMAAVSSNDIWFADVNDFIHYGCSPAS